MTHLISTLASPTSDILVVVGVLTGLTATVVIAGIVLHRKMASDHSNDHRPPPFDLHQLRQMHENGQLTQAEYDRAVAALIARQSAANASPPTHSKQATPPQQSDSTLDASRD